MFAGEPPPGAHAHHCLMCAPRSARTPPIGVHDHPPGSRVERHVAKQSIAARERRVLRSSFSSTIRSSPAWRSPYSSSARSSPSRIARSIRAISRRAASRDSDGPEESDVLGHAPSSRGSSRRAAAPSRCGRRPRPRRIGTASSEPSRGRGAERPRSGAPWRSRIPDRRRRRRRARRPGRPAA